MTQGAAPTATAKGPYYATVEAAEIFGRRLLTAHGLPDEDAKIVAGCLVRADLRGVDTHGLQYLPHYLDRLRRGLINPKPVLKVEKVTPMIGALDVRGMRAMMTVEGGTDADVFEAFVEQVLVRKLRPGDIVVLDNLTAHKSPRVAEILARKNCTVRYLPPYSPDFNPIEMAISKLKSALRKLAERTVAGLLAILEGCAGLFKPTDCQSYFKACGYDPAELQTLDTT